MDNALPSAALGLLVVPPERLGVFLKDASSRRAPRFQGQWRVTCLGLRFLAFQLQELRMALWPLAQEVLALLKQLATNVCAKPTVSFLQRLQLERELPEAVDLGRKW